MKSKLLLLIFLLVSACGEKSTEQLFAESLKSGAESEGYEISGSTADCMVNKSLPLMDQQRLESDLLSGSEYNVNNIALYSSEATRLEADKLRLICMTDDEFVDSVVATSQLTGENEVRCWIKLLGGKEKLFGLDENSNVLQGVYQQCAEFK